MKRKFMILLICAAGLMATAQEKADILVSYTEQFRNWESDTLATRRMSLLANSRQTKYFNDLSLWSDSLSSTPEGSRQLKQIIMAACMTELPGGGISMDLRKGPVKSVHQYVFTDLGKGEVTLYDKFGSENGYYTDSDGIDWEIGESTVSIMGYECVEATANYHGRKWKAWFTPEIPVPAGPWKLRGLPGLILRAESDNDVSFVANGLQQTDRVISPIYSKENYQRTDRKKALADEEYFRNNREALLRATFSGKVVFENSTKEQPKYDAARYSLEPDYKQ